MVTEKEGGVRAGIDLGGTGTRIVIMENQQQIAVAAMPTALFDSVPDAMRSGRLAQKVRELLPAGKRLISLGIGASGPVNNQTGIIENNDTLAAFSYFPLVEQMQQHLGVPVNIDNDAVAAALGEYYLGAGRGSQRLLMVTLGTGVGVALLDNGKPWRTATGAHPEAGHIPVGGDSPPCYCGLEGCWESLAARSWLQKALHATWRDEPYDDLALPYYQQRCEADPDIAGIFARYGRHVGRGLNSLLTLYGPDITLLSGSAAHFYPLFQPGMASALSRAAGYAVNKQILPSQLGDSAGALGAALLYRLERAA